MSAAAAMLFAASVCALGGCASAQSDETPGTVQTGSDEVSASPSTSASTLPAPGPAQGSAQYAGVPLQPCSPLELEGYPTGLARASQDYYQGPWCGRSGDDRLYIWFFARTLVDDPGGEQARRDIVTDVEVLSLDLAAQGYERVCGDLVVDERADIGFERPGELQMIRLTASIPGDGQGGQGTTGPGALVVSVGPASFNAAVVPGGLAPNCPQR